MNELQPSHVPFQPNLEDWFGLGSRKLILSVESIELLDYWMRPSNRHKPESNFSSIKDLLDIDVIM